MLYSAARSNFYVNAMWTLRSSEVPLEYGSRIFIVMFGRSTSDGIEDSDGGGSESHFYGIRLTNHDRC